MSWKQLEYFVVRSLNSFDKSKLLATQKEGLTVCIPKGDKPKNWRPISVRHVIYKIGVSCIANRLKKVLPSLIDEDQTGFMSDTWEKY